MHNFINFEPQGQGPETWYVACALRVDAGFAGLLRRLYRKRPGGMQIREMQFLDSPFAARELLIAEMREQIRVGENATIIFHAAKTSTDEIYLATVMRSRRGRPVQNLHGPRFRGDRTQELKFFRAWH